MRSNLKTALYTALAGLLVLLVLEGAVRLVASVMGDVDRAREAAAAEQWELRSPTLGWERRPGFKGSVGGFEREFDSAGFLTVDSAQAATRTDAKRVLFIGDSNTFGFGAATPASFVEQAEKLMPGIAAINLGVIGYTSYQGRKVLEQALPRLKPDLVVASFNFNDRRYVTSAAAADSAETFARGFQGARVAAVIKSLEWSYLVRALSRALQAVKLLPSPINRVDVSTLHPRVSPEAYRDNLSAMVTEASKFGVPVIFLLLSDHPIQSEHLNRGLERLQAKDYDGAIALLKAAAGEHAMFADLARLSLAQAYAGKGDSADAARVRITHSIYQSFSGGTLIRTADAYNAAMREVATSQGAQVVDGAAQLNQRPWVFVDFCHFNAEGHALVGAALAQQIGRALALPAGTAAAPAKSP